ncbi:putative filament-like plant protein [Lupinus albus]|uniref:Putative filament-like plant protein n=1 Tax=Lupinus albus TaxID=3870 RepID=A0A6A4PWY4_LUPAL|nr:putative filament-like plant protein [Lupinus albus]
MPFNFQSNNSLLNPVMMDKKIWLWKRKSSDKSPGETESSGSVSSYSERYSDEQEESKESSNGSKHSPDVTSKAVDCDEDDNDSSIINAKSVPTTGITNDGSLERDENGENENITKLKDGDLNDGLKTLSENLPSGLVNVNAKEDLVQQHAKEDLVQQHAKVAEEAIAGWEKAEKEVVVLKKQLDVVTLRNSALEDRVAHLDGALKECVRQLRQTREVQEEKIHDAVVKKTLDLESAKIELENKLVELQSKLDASNAKSSIDIGMSQRVEYLEKQNMALRHELLARLEELETMTIERDLSTQAVETASKQHLENIKKIAKLEVECRRLKSIASRASCVNDHISITSSSFCVEPLKDGQSDSGEWLNAVEIDTQKMSGSELNKCEPSCSDSWASALIAELDQFKNEKCKQQTPSSSVKIDLMDDFLEMERLVALPETKNENIVRESVVANQCIYQQMQELKDNLEKIEAEKAELVITLMNSEDCIKESQLQLREAENKLDELQRELENAYKSNQIIENELLSMKAHSQTLSAKVDLLEAEVDKERSLSNEVAIKYKELEDEILRSIAISYGEKKIKQEDLEVAAGKLAECQKTIATLGDQLKSLATIEDFLIDTATLPASPSLVVRASGETWKLHPNERIFA